MDRWPAGTARSSPAIVAASVAVVLALPAAAYAAVGDQSSTAPPYADHLWHPPSWSERDVRAVGVAAAIVALAGLGVLVRAARRRELPRVVAVIDGLLVVAGLVVALGSRVLTAGVTGANIGGGMVLMFGPPLVAGLLVAATVTAVRRGRGCGPDRSRSSPR